MVIQPKFLQVAKKALSRNPGYYAKYLTVYFFLDTKAKAHIGADGCLKIPDVLNDIDGIVSSTGFTWWNDAITLAAICAVHGGNHPDTLCDLATNIEQAVGKKMGYRKGAISCAVALLQHHQGEREKFAKLDAETAWQGTEGKKRKKPTAKVMAG